MDVVISTYGVSLISEWAHSACQPIPASLVATIADKMGPAYFSEPTMCRWSGILSIMGAYGTPAIAIPFLMVSCTRGASIRCPWDHMDTLMQVIGMMVPDIIATQVDEIHKIAATR